MIIRDAIEGDAEAIAAIYNDAVVNTTAIWNDTRVDTANRLTFSRGDDGPNWTPTRILHAFAPTAWQSVAPHRGWRRSAFDSRAAVCHRPLMHLPTDFTRFRYQGGQLLAGI